MRKDYNFAMNVTKTAVDDLGVANYTGYRNAEVDKLIDKQSAGA